jgi:hypothetical protein
LFVGYLLKRKVWVLAVLVGLCVLFAGILFSAWIGVMSIGLMGSASPVIIMNFRFVEGAPTGDIIRLTIQNTGPTVVNIFGGYVDEIKAINFDSEKTFNIPKGYSLELPLIFPNDTLVYGNHCTVKVTTNKGTTLIYSVIYDSAHTSQYDPLKDDLSPTPFEDVPEPFGTPLLTMPFAVFLVATLVFVPVACKLACYIVGPKNKVELVMLLFLVTVMVVSVIIYVVTMVLFPPQISL